MIDNLIVFGNLRFQNVFCVHLTAKPACSNSSGLYSVFEVPRFRDGLVWTEGLRGETKLRSQIYPA